MFVDMIFYGFGEDVQQTDWAVFFGWGVEMRSYKDGSNVGAFPGGRKST